jgi:hypothetical protein
MKKQVLTTVCALILGSGVSAAAQEIVRIGPPPARHHEFRPPPSPAKHLWGWVPGYYHFDGGQYVWVSGAYVEGPTDHPHWTEGHWDPKDGGYLWTEGFWKK